MECLQMITFRCSMVDRVAVQSCCCLRCACANLHNDEDLDSETLCKLGWGGGGGVVSLKLPKENRCHLKSAYYKIHWQSSHLVHIVKQYISESLKLSLLIVINLGKFTLVFLKIMPCSWFWWVWFLETYFLGRHVCNKNVLVVTLK